MDAATSPRCDLAALRPEDPWLLFDNQEDPYQMVNLIDDPAQGALREKFNGMLRRFIEEAHDPFVLPKPANKT